MITLSGPGVACSSMRVRRLVAGELAGDERARSEAHVAACDRCRTTVAGLEAERAALARALPFPEFAAGVAERLAAAPPRPRAAVSRLAVRAVPLALAAGLAAVALVPTLRGIILPGEDPTGDRRKGGAAAEVHVATPGGSRALARGEPVPAGAPIRVALVPAGRGHAAVALVDRDGPSLLFSGPAPGGPIPGAFEWTGQGDGELVVVLDDRPVDGAALLARLRAHGVGAAAPGGSAEVLVLPLTRGRR